MGPSLSSHHWLTPRVFTSPGSARAPELGRGRWGYCINSPSLAVLSFWHEPLDILTMKKLYEWERLSCMMFLSEGKYDIRKQIRIKPCLSLNKEYLFKSNDQYLKHYWIMCAAKESTFILLLFCCIMVSKGSLNDYDSQVKPCFIDTCDF